MGEIGKNMMAVEYGNNIIVIDAGLMFPQEDMLGVDLVIPDIGYLLEHKEKVRGIVITHAHEDHIGALPYVLPRINVPVYSTRLSRGIISVKLREATGFSEKPNLIEVTPGIPFTLGPFQIELFPVCHSIPDAAGIIINTPIGTVVHTGDFKLDYTPVDNKLTNLSRLAQEGDKGILALFSDSTYADQPGYTPSEKTVGEALEQIIASAPGRVIITTFASLVSRAQQVIDAAAKHGRKVIILGRSMLDTTSIARQLGYLQVPENVLGQARDLESLSPQQVVLLTTGSQGEPTSALVRIANRDHRQISIMRGDTVVISASPIPGNESLVHRTINNLMRQGAHVLYDKIVPVHVHGHASQEELKLVLNLARPRFFIPVHGEYRHLSYHASLAKMMGVPESNVFVLENGQLLELTEDSGRIVGKVQSGNAYVDGLSVGDVGSVVLRDRLALAHDGIVVAIVVLDNQSGHLVSRPDIVSYGFVDPAESEKMLEESRDLVAKAIDHTGKPRGDGNLAANKAKEVLERFFYQKTGRRPMILPVVVNI